MLRVVSVKYTLKGGNKVAKKATGNRKGQQAFAVLQQWRTQGAPDVITSYEAWNLTGGLVGAKDSVSPIRLVDVAMKYANKGGSTKDQQALHNN
jgi:hypothetical protein